MRSLLTTENYTEAVVKGVSLGDDTDTIGALTGGAAGIIYGRENINKKWIDKLRNKELIYELCDAFEERSDRLRNAELWKQK